MVRFVKIFLLWTLYGMMSKVLFMAVHHSLLADAGIVDRLAVFYHGARLDMAVAGYLTVIPMLMLIVALWHNSKALRWIWNGYFIVASFCVALAFILNVGLYGYWGFPLDTTPLFYFTSSPVDAMASMEWWMMAIAVVAISVLTIAMFLPFRSLFPSSFYAEKSALKGRVGRTVGGLLCLAALIIPIRGGFTVAVNNVGSVYFSEDIRLNHAAVNPVFSFFESATNDEDFSSQYRFMDDKEATALFEKMTYTALRDTTDNVIIHRPQHIIIIVLESFSRLIMDIPNVTPQLDSLTAEGLYFTNFYADSFRTDRGLVSILSGYPAQPTMSLMKYPAKTNNLYSIARSLSKEGYATQYVYGGDANFTNMRSYLMATGFTNIISDKDYDRQLRDSKWGVHDEHLFDRAMKEISADKAGQKTFRVIQTSSSHEPYDVPMHVIDNERLNAFHYTDHCLGAFVRQLRQRPEWDNTLLVIVPDHLGCYPVGLDNYALSRYQIPMVMLGGVIRQPGHIDTIASQHDIPATLLGMMGIDHSEFLFSKDILDGKAPHFAYFAIPDAMGMVTADNTIIYDNVSGKTVLNEGNKPGCNLRPVQAYLQKLYDDIAELK